MQCYQTNVFQFFIQFFFFKRVKFPWKPFNHFDKPKLLQHADLASYMKPDDVFSQSKSGQKCFLFLICADASTRINLWETQRSTVFTP